MALFNALKCMALMRQREPLFLCLISDLAKRNKLRLASTHGIRNRCIRYILVVGVGQRSQHMVTPLPIDA